MWLLVESILAVIEGAQANNWAPSAQQFEQFEAADYTSGERITSVVGDSAEIKIEGVLTKSPDIFARWFGGGNTTYQEIIAATQAADANTNVSEIVYRINSGGGSISGLFEAVIAISSAEKPTRAIVDDMAASAAYALVSQADTIEASSIGAMVGSVGVVTARHISANTVEITSTEAPEKRPDASTEEGRASIRAFLDSIHTEFVGAIAEGRGTTAETVNANFGRGGMVLAKSAIEKGMIDSIVGASSTSSADNESHATERGSVMDLEQFKAAHPAIYAEAVKAGTTAERERASAHLIMGKSYNAMPLALEAVEKGDEFSGLYQAKYLAAKADADTASARAADDEENGTEGNAATEVPEAKDEETKAHEAILAEMEAENV